MIIISYTIEPTWTFDTFTGEVEITERELRGLTGADRDAKITRIVAEAVANEAPWGWTEMPSEPREGDSL